MSAITSRRSARALIAVTTILLLAAACTPAKEAPTHQGGALGSLPSEAAKPKDGGVISVALPVGLTPNSMFPIAASTDLLLAPQLLVQALYVEGDVGTTDPINADLSLAELPKFSADGKTVTITMKEGNKWSNGAPVVADDLLFSIELIKAAVALSPANWASYTPGGFPDNVARATAPDKYTVQLDLTAPVNPGYFLHTVAVALKPLPSTAWNVAAPEGPHLDSTNPANAKKIYTYLSTQGRELAHFTTNPLWKTVDGPFQLKSFDPATGGFSLVPNAAYSGADPSRVDEVQFRPFTSTQAMLNQLLAGGLTVGALDASYATQVNDLKKKGYQVYGRPGSSAVNPLVINFANTTNHFDKVIAQLYVRQALQHVIDQPGYIKSRGVYNGAAAPNYSTAQADSLYAPTFGDKPPYPFDLAAAKKLLADHGWKVVENGTTTCQSAGTGPTDCGAGIPQGQELSFNLLYANSPASNVNRDLAFISAAKRLGITITGEAKALNFLYQNTDNNSSPAYKDKWAMVDEGAFTMGSYPSSYIFLNSKAFFNLGSFNDPKADALIDASVHSTDPDALVAETTYIGKNLPWLFMPNPDNIAVWSDQISGPPSSFANLTAYGLVGANPQAWYFHD